MAQTDDEGPALHTLIMSLGDRSGGQARSQPPPKGKVRAIVADQVAAEHCRGPAEPDPNVQLAQLHDLLVQAAQAYEAGPQSQREAVCASLIATVEFLKHQGFTAATLWPLTRALLAIVEVAEHNRPDPLFCEKTGKTKPRRSMDDAVRQGHLAALADAWLRAHVSDEGDAAAKLKRAARWLSGLYFGKLSSAALRSAIGYQRQNGHPDLLYASFTQMQDALKAEGEAAGGGEAGLRTAAELQLVALNAKAEFRPR